MLFTIRTTLPSGSPQYISNHRPRHSAAGVPSAPLPVYPALRARAPKWAPSEEVGVCVLEGGGGGRGTWSGWLRTAPQKRREGISGCEPGESEAGPDVLQHAARVLLRRVAVSRRIKYHTKECQECRAEVASSGMFLSLTEFCRLMSAPRCATTITSMCAMDQMHINLRISMGLCSD